MYKVKRMLGLYDDGGDEAKYIFKLKVYHRLFSVCNVCNEFLLSKSDGLFHCSYLIKRV